MFNHTIVDVIAAYEKALRLQVRQMQIETTREETQIECDERIDAVCYHAEIELQYISEFT